MKVVVAVVRQGPVNVVVVVLWGRIFSSGSMPPHDVVVVVVMMIALPFHRMTVGYFYS